MKFRIAANTYAAGKYNPLAPLLGNEDNMFVSADLNDIADGGQFRFDADEVVNLSDKGCLLVVADGMGGMNAGEVASDIAIKTVMQYFAPERLTDKIVKTSRARTDYLETVVVAADAAIKADSCSNKNHEGMGSTIILAWICDGEMSLTWCGDSRAYLFRPGHGFVQISKDHSYVQGLVDEGKITMDEAFDHPYGNIITRSLGDPEKKAKPESRMFEVFEGDIIMLCSDGLSGVLRDHKTYVDGKRIENENLEDIIAANLDSMDKCCNELFAAAERNEWYDNVTTILCEITKGKAAPSNDTLFEKAKDASASAKIAPSPLNTSRITISKKKLPVIVAIVLLVLAAAGFFGWKLATGNIDREQRKAEKLAFENCATLTEYRNFVKDYPDGKFFKKASEKIDKLVNDSINSANSKNDSESTIVQEEKRNEAPVNSVNVTKQVEQNNTEQQTVTEQSGNQGSIADLIKKDNESGPAAGEEKPALTPAESGSGGLTDAGNSGKTNATITPMKPQQSNPKSEEEAYQRCMAQNATIEDCLYYLDTYGKKAKHSDNVMNMFNQLYYDEWRKCKTVEDIDVFLGEHVGIMKKARIEGGGVDQDIRKKAEEKRAQLANGSSRPKAGVQNAPQH